MKQIIAKIKKTISTFKKANPKIRGAELALGITAAVSLVTYNYYNSKKPEPTTLSKEEVSTPFTVENPIHNNEVVASGNFYEECMANDLPSFINVSLNWYGRTFGTTLKSLSPPSVVVVSAGNGYPMAIRPEKVEASKDKDLNIILVGSMAPDGRRSSFFNTHKEVHIMAPSDHYIRSAIEDDIPAHFGGTSGEPLL